MARVSYTDSVQPLLRDEFSGDALARFAPLANFNIFRALAHSGPAYRGYWKFAVQFAFAELDARTREAVILAVAADVGSTYVWNGHRRTAEAAGIEPGTLDSIRAGGVVGLAASEAAAVTYARAVENCNVDAIIWSETRRYFNDRQIVEVTLLATFYGLTSRTAIALDIEEDP